MKITTGNTMELPVRPYEKEIPRVHDDDTWYQKDPFWKDKKYDFFNYECDSALITTGIGTRSCPTVGEWAAFAVAGAVIATLNGKYIQAPDGTEGMENRIWAALWRASEDNKEKLDRKFMAAMLREFFPRSYYCPPDRPYRMSNFVSFWDHFEYPDTVFHSVGNVRQARLSKGIEDLNKLDKSVAASIKEVAVHVPMMLEIAIQRIGKTYMW